MAVETKTFTGAIAIIKHQGVAIGRMTSVNANESFTRIDVRGLGTIMPQESCVVQWNGTLTCSFFEIDYKRTGIPTAVFRNVQNNTDFENQIVLNYDGVQVDIYKRIQDVIDPVTKIVRPFELPYATIRRALIDSDSFNVSEGQVAGRNQSFRYLDPIILPS